MSRLPATHPGGGVGETWLMPAGDGGMQRATLGQSQGRSCPSGGVCPELAPKLIKSGSGLAPSCSRPFQGLGCFRQDRRQWHRGQCSRSRWG